MRQSSTIKSSSEEAQYSSLNPVLQDALVSIDVQLEEELIRYRRQRALGKAGYKPRRSGYAKGATALDLMSVGSRQENNQAIGSSSTNLSSTNLSSTNSSSTDSGSTDSGSAHGIGFSPTEKVPPLTAIAPTHEEEMPSSSSLELKELAKQYASQVAEASDLASANGECPDDYLESSEELLRSLAQEEAAVQTEQGFMQSLLTPLGMGSMLLLLISSVMFGFVVMNPSSISQLFASRNGQSGTTTLGGDPGTPNSQATGTDVPQPNLANQEFPDLNLGTLGSVKVGDNPLPPAIAGQMPTLGKGAKPTNPRLKGSSAVVIDPDKIASSLPTSSEPKISQTSPEPAPAVSVPSPRKLSAAPAYKPPAARSYNPPAPRRANPPAVRKADPTPVRSYNPPVNPPIVKTPIVKTPTAKPPAVKVHKSIPIQPYQPSTYKSPAPSYKSPAPTPSGFPSPAASASPATSGSYGYKVVTPYTSDRSLEQAREKVPEAYLNNYSDGAKVQLGSYQDEASARARAAELRQQGLPAEVYKP